MILFHESVREIKCFDVEDYFDFSLHFVSFSCRVVQRYFYFTAIECSGRSFMWLKIRSSYSTLKETCSKMRFHFWRNMKDENGKWWNWIARDTICFWLVLKCNEIFICHNEFMIVDCYWHCQVDMELRDTSRHSIVIVVVAHSNFDLLCLSTRVSTWDVLDHITKNFESSLA